jgi:hypothetical protein
LDAGERSSDVGEDGNEKRAKIPRCSPSAPFHTTSVKRGGRSLLRKMEINAKEKDRSQYEDFFLLRDDDEGRGKRSDGGHETYRHGS